ncbi:uncharacterized protein BDW47DRAFT_26436 [Aspergillus candidus]|uniref:Uncharacterized protein n=1 Tax=Aspergillus candidus TaxID=41067 RepID=A0A2I2FNS4_ASPCN|nr:hypothetical protein BDW47DRAFT_26436 [Aspergillus candidus]PLB42269.1 hypothetical protein BDW47DRAFT_26436 [Aspergillus candidus]
MCFLCYFDFDPCSSGVTFIFVMFYFIFPFYRWPWLQFPGGAKRRLRAHLCSRLLRQLQTKLNRHQELQVGGSECTAVVEAIRGCANRGHWNMVRCPAIQPFPIKPDRDPSEAIALPRKSTGSGDSDRGPMRCQWPGSGSSQRARILELRARDHL